jgi:hypothetical protein
MWGWDPTEDWAKLVLDLMLFIMSFEAYSALHISCQNRARDSITDPGPEQVQSAITASQAVVL